MKVFQLKSDFNFQSFYPYDPNDSDSPQVRELLRADILMGQETPRLPSWIPAHLYPDKPMLERGNFAHLWGFGGFVADSRACEALRPILEQSCELLPFLPHEGEIFHKINVLTIIDCLDMRRTKWRTNRATGKRLTEIEEYHFIPELLVEGGLFRLPKRGRTLLTVTGRAGQEDDFRAIVEREGLTGLKFEELWSENGPPIRSKSFIDKVLG